jgi:FkbM family methyltransferase
MKREIKNILRQLLIRLRLPLTKNIAYDIATEKILKKVLKSDSNCIDVGAHKGEILELYFKYAPQGRHIGFEPIPVMYEGLKNKYSQKATIHPYALSSESGRTTFNVVHADPAYSGLQQREYKTSNPAIEKIEVEVRTLDELMAGRNFTISLIKIDVEGGEMGVMRGSESVLKTDRPILIFECGRGASEYYGTSPEEVFGFLEKLGYSLYTLEEFIKNDKLPMNKGRFVEYFKNGIEYYFIAKS